MNLIQRFKEWLVALLRPGLDALRTELQSELAERIDLSIKQADITLRQTDLQLRKDIYAELKRVGLAIGELQSRAVFTTQTPDNLYSLGDRLTVLEKVLIAATEPKKPGNHIGPGHEFGNKIRL